MMNIKISILNQNIVIPGEIVEAADGNELLARIFFNRGYREPDTIRQMLHENLYNPTGTTEFPQMENAVRRIAEAIDQGEIIAVYGDYDVDGVTSTVTLVQCLKKFTGSVMYHVPDRFTEGYGMNSEVIRNMKEKGVSLIITCDCGISNTNEIKLCKELGMDVVITDHHNVPDILPSADVILNPKLLPAGHRARNLSGCAMAYFLCLALLEHYKLANLAEEFLDLLALSLVADVVSLNGENRHLLKKALPKLFNTERIGLKKLFQVIEQNCKLQTEEDIAFQIAPRINAAGRMDTARLPVELLLCEDGHQAFEMSQRIDLLNSERKRIQQDIIRQAAEMVENRKKNKTVLVLFNEFWHHGIIGIAAGKICEMYRKPAILLSMKEDGSTVVGSARSIEEVNIYEMIKECSSKLIKFGGHSAAAGLSLERHDLEEFTKTIEDLAEKKYFIKHDIVADVDAELEESQINDRLYDTLCTAGPFGEGFEKPAFATRNITVASDRRTEKNHHIMILAGENDTRIHAVKWFGSDESYQGKTFDITYNIGKNNYKGSSGLQLTLDYILEAGGIPKKVFEGNIVDARKSEIADILQKYDDTVVFYEGMSSACPLADTLDRYSMKRGKNLVFLSAPVNSLVFREVVASANPTNIIINFSVLFDYTFKGFILNLMGTLKHIANRENGRSSLENISMRLGVEENIIKAALKFMKARGKITYTLNTTDSKVFIDICSRPQSGDVHILEKNLCNALLEKNAYQQFITRLEADSFREYLK